MVRIAQFGRVERAEVTSQLPPVDSPEDVAIAYATLIARVRQPQSGVSKRQVPLFFFKQQNDPNQFAQFDPESWPRVFIYRAGLQVGGSKCPELIARDAPNPIEEFAYVLHELGHYESWLRGSYARPHDAPERQYEEEFRAWYLGRVLVEVETAVCWRVLEPYQRHSLESYRAGYQLAVGVVSDCEQRAVEDLDARVLIQRNLW